MKIQMNRIALVVLFIILILKTNAKASNESSPSIVLQNQGIKLQKGELDRDQVLSSLVSRERDLLTQIAVDFLIPNGGGRTIERALIESFAWNILHEQNASALLEKSFKTIAPLYIASAISGIPKINEILNQSKISDPEKTSAILYAICNKDLLEIFGPIIAYNSDIPRLWKSYRADRNLKIDDATIEYVASQIREEIKNEYSGNFKSIIADQKWISGFSKRNQSKKIESALDTLSISHSGLTDRQSFNKLNDWCKQIDIEVTNMNKIKQNLNELYSRNQEEINSIIKKKTNHLLQKDFKRLLDAKRSESDTILGLDTIGNVLSVKLAYPWQCPNSEGVENVSPQWVSDSLNKSNIPNEIVGNRVFLTKKIDIISAVDVKKEDLEDADFSSEYIERENNISKLNEYGKKGWQELESLNKLRMSFATIISAQNNSTTTLQEIAITCSNIHPKTNSPDHIELVYDLQQFMSKSIQREASESDEAIISALFVNYGPRVVRAAISDTSFISLRDGIAKLLTENITKENIDESRLLPQEIRFFSIKSPTNNFYQALIWFASKTNVYSIKNISPDEISRIHKLFEFLKESITYNEAADAITLDIDQLVYKTIDNYNESAPSGINWLLDVGISYLATVDSNFSVLTLMQERLGFGYCWKFRSGKPKEKYDFSDRPSYIPTNWRAWKYIHSISIDVFASGLLYRIIDVKSKSSFNDPIVGIGPTMRYNNGLAISAGYMSNLQDGSLYKHMFFGNVNISIFDYLSDLAKKTSK